MVLRRHSNNGSINSSEAAVAVMLVLVIIVIMVVTEVEVAFHLVFCVHGTYQQLKTAWGYVRERLKVFLDSLREVIVEVLGKDEVAWSGRRTATGQSGNIRKVR